MRPLFIAVCLVASASLAQKVEPTRKAAPAQELVFGEGDLIAGELARPLGEIYLVPPDRKFGSLIKIRMNFDDKLRQSVHEM